MNISYPLKKKHLKIKITTTIKKTVERLSLENVYRANIFYIILTFKSLKTTFFENN